MDQLTEENDLLPGPDLYQLFQNHPEYLEDGVHPNASGCRTLQEAWAEAVTILYEGSDSPG